MVRDPDGVLHSVLETVFFFLSGVHNLDFGIPFSPFPMIFPVTLEAFGSFSVEWL